MKEQIKKAMKRTGLYGYYAPFRRAQLNTQARKIAFREYGLKFVLNANIWEIFEDRIYTEFDDFIPTEKDTVFDIGAQYGDYALLCASLGATVHSFEPLPKNFEIILKNIRKNELIKGQVIANRKAIGSYTKTIEIPYDNDMAAIKGNKKVETDMTTIDDYILETGAEPTILKIDIEGWELEALRGAAQTLERYRPKIIIETHSSQLKKDCLDFLSLYGYKIAHEGRKVELNETKDNIWMDEIQNLFLEV